MTTRRVRTGSRPGDRYVRIFRPTAGKFEQDEEHHLIATEAVFERPGMSGHVERLRRFMVGARLPSAMESHERLGVVKGLAVFASDNISSSAYATEEIMRVLVLAGAGALMLTMPITIAIVLVLIVVVTSYQQTIHAYPTGGGSYIVASDNLGPLPGLVAAASLLTDYVLTVAVSVAAGVAALTSIFPVLFDERVVVSLAFVLLICLGNLRGIRESGTIFAAPAYIYLFAIFGLLGYGMMRYVTGTLPDYVAPEEWGVSEGTSALGLLLILRAFSSGSVALTGVEAVSNGVPAFSAPESKHAQRVLIIMGACFVTIFLGMSFLAGHVGILPDPTEQKTVISQLTSALVGEGSPYHYLVQLSTALLLILAANTAYADFPRLSSILARDGYWPRQFQYRGDRLAFTTGIFVLTILASLLLVVFQASVTNLIPLYTVGVFIAFTLSQSGMVRHWWKLRESDRGWWRRASFNTVGALATGVVAVVVGVAKFALGAWVVLILVPVLMALMMAIHRHYLGVRSVLTMDEVPPMPKAEAPQVIVPISRLDRAAYRAVTFARSISPAVMAVHVSENTTEAEATYRAWEEWDTGVELVIVESPYRSLLPPLLAYIDAMRASEAGRPVVVVVAEFVPRYFWQNFLHNQAALRLKVHLLSRPNVIVANVPSHLWDAAAAKEGTGVR
ncbi:MAG: APC family permease [Dehalococcoidia bacterium]|nr:MAG: APC family permease [Dehalococcoidia bacterium]